MINVLDVPSSFQSRWYAVQAKPKQEKRAALNLASAGLKAFLPMIHTVRRGRAASGKDPAPLFPQYLFVQCDITMSVHTIRYTRGVAKVLGGTEGPTPIDDVIIESIERRIGDDGLVRLSDSLEVGDPVEIMWGPLKGLRGIFRSATSAAERVMLLLDALDSPMRVSVDSNVVRKMAV